jgi:hypothetical protein
MSERSGGGGAIPFPLRCISSHFNDQQRWRRQTWLFFNRAIVFLGCVLKCTVQFFVRRAAARCISGVSI